MAKIFISYKRNIEPDTPVATAVYEALRQEHEVFIDTTIQVGEKCPGRIGQWIGWEIVKEYMKENKEVSLPELMDMGDAQRLFKESGYKPKKR